MPMGTLEPKTPREKLRDLALMLAFAGVAAIPGVPLMRWMVPLPSPDFWIALLILVVASAGSLWMWTRLDRPLKKRRFGFSITFFLLGDVGLIYSVVAVVARGAAALDL